VCNRFWNKINFRLGDFFFCTIYNNQFSAMRILSLSFGLMVKNAKPLGRRVKFVKEGKLQGTADK